MADRDPFDLLGSVADQPEMPADAFAERLLDDLIQDLHDGTDRASSHGHLPIDDHIPVIEPGEETDMTLTKRWPWALVVAAAAALILVVVIAVANRDDNEGLIIDNPTPTVAPTPPDPTPAATATSEPDPSPTEPAAEPAVVGSDLPADLGRSFRDGGPLVNPGLSQTSNVPVRPLAPDLYSLELAVPATLEIIAIEDLPGGIAFTDQMRSGDMERQFFFPAGFSEEDYLAAIVDFHDPLLVPNPDSPADANITKAPFFEVVHLPTLGTSAEEVAVTITESDLEILSGPTAAQLGGVDAIVIEATAASRVVVAEGADLNTRFQSLPQLEYHAGSMLRIYVVPVGEAVLLVTISTDAVGFDAWVAVAEQYLAGLSFT